MPRRVPSPTEPAPDRVALHGALAAGLLMLLGLLYGRSLGFGGLEVGDAALRAPASLGAAWSAGGPAGASLYLERAESALPSRLVALLLHAGSAALVLGLGRRLGLGPAGALALALLFALHPLRVEPVAWLSQRAALLSGFLLLLAAWLALGVRTRASRALAAAAALAGAVCLALPPPAEDPLGFTVRLAELPRSLGALAAGWAVPWLAPAPGIARVLGWAALGAGALLLARLPVLRRRAPRVRLGVLGGLAFLVLASAGALTAPDPRVASTGYLAVLGLELALVAALQALGTRAAAGGALLLVCAWSPLAWSRVDDWRSEEARQARALARDPRDARAHDALGRLHLVHGRLSEAQREHERALALQPELRLARLHLGELELRRALVPGQEEHFLRAEQELLRCEPAGSLTARVAAALGEVYQRTEDYPRAHEELRRAVAADSCDARTQARLGMVALRLGSLLEAKAAFERATELAPELASGAVEGWCGRGVVALQQNDLVAARAHLERALELEPDHPESNATLGHVLELAGDGAGAERHYRRALGVNPDSVDALYALGARLAASASEPGHADEALRLLERVVALSRARHVRALKDSARLWIARGEIERARERLRAVLELNPDHAEARALLESLNAAPR
jgi:protein O-mannosyl-transferase